MQLPRKMSAQNVVASISSRLGNREHKTTGNEIRFAGDERKDKLYEPKHKQKLVRVLTVVAYVIFVSLAAILLSLYYTFLWDPKDVSVKMRLKPECITKLPNTHNSQSTISGETQIGKVTTKTLPEINEQSVLSESNTTEWGKSLTILTVTSEAPANASYLEKDVEIETTETPKRTTSKINEVS